MYAAYHESRKRGWKQDAWGVASLQVKVGQYLINKYIEKYGAERRGWIYSQEKGKMVSVQMYSIQALQESFDQEGKNRDDIVYHIPDLVVGPKPIVDNLMTECVVVPALSRIYSQASDDLKGKMVEWFWYTKDKYHVKSKSFKEASKEFRHLCRSESIVCDDCVHLVTSPRCLDSLSRTIFGIPYDNGCYPIVN